MDGIVNFMKPADMTSHDAVSFFRRLTGIRRIGHTGTLDPMATGVLPICIGKATRLIEYLSGDKAYRAILKLGMTSETGDIWGQHIISSHELTKYPADEEIESVLMSFKGQIEQQVPGFSAQKHNGRKLYEYARAGEDIPVKKKVVNIKDVTVKSIDAEKNEIMMEIECSKGTYIRTICTDAGEKLGTGGLMSMLIRTNAGGLDIADSVTMEELEEEKKNSGNIDKFISTPSKYLSHMKKITLNEHDSKKFANGISIELDGTGFSIVKDAVCTVYTTDKDNQELLIGIGTGSSSNQLKPRKVIHQEL